MTEEEIKQLEKRAELRKKKFGTFMVELPDPIFQQIVSHWITKEDAPEYDDDLAEWVIEVCGYFPLCWNLDKHLYPLLQKRPQLATLLSLGNAKDAGAIRDNIRGRYFEGEDSLLKAAQTGKVECIKGLLAVGVNVNATNIYSKWTPLYYAASNGRTECVRLLLATPGVNLNVTEKNGDTLFHWVALNVHNTECVMLLLAIRGKDINAKNKDGWTPLHSAANYIRADYIQMLLEYPGVEVNAKSNYGVTPLHLVVQTGHPVGRKEDRIECVRLLLADPRVNVNAKDDYNRTPLHLASEYLEIIRLLLAASGVDVNARDNYSSTPLHLAAHWGHKERIRLLLAVPGVEVNAKNKDDNTPLHLAAYQDKKECVRLLLAAPGVDVNAKNKDGRTPYELSSDVIRDLFRSQTASITQGGKPKSTATKEKVLYNGKKYVVRVGAKGGTYILVGSEKKKVYV